MKEDARTRGVLWWCACAIGWLLMSLAVWGIVTEVDLAAFTRWFVGGLVIHDALAAPLCLAVGAVLARRIRHRAVRDVVSWSLWVVLLMALVWWPSLTARGLHADNPSILPRPYVQNFVLATAVVVVVTTAVLTGLRFRAARRGGGR